MSWRCPGHGIHECAMTTTSPFESVGTEAFFYPFLEQSGVMIIYTFTTTSPPQRMPAIKMTVFAMAVRHGDAQPSPAATTTAFVHQIGRDQRVGLPAA